MPDSEKKWDWVISSNIRWSGGIRELIAYRHLLRSLVRREFLLNYQQTLLGPLWILFQPLLTLLTYVLVFGHIIGIPTGGNLPPVLFYFSGIILWNFFSDSFMGTTGMFRENSYLFSKVYFPRIIMPVSLVTTHFLRMAIQLLMLILILSYYMLFEGFRIPVMITRVGFPLAILLVGILSFSMGLIFSILTAKYRDLTNVISIGIRLLMFLTPVIYPLSAVDEKFRWVVGLNPLTPLFELFRLGLFGEGTVNLGELMYSIAFALVALFISLFLYKKFGPRLIDVI